MIKQKAGLALALGGLALAFGCHVALGANPIPLPEVAAALLDYDDTVFEHVIIWELRLPRAVMAVAVGAALSVGDALMQGVKRNPLSDPGLLGLGDTAGLAMNERVWQKSDGALTFALPVRALAVFAGLLALLVFLTLAGLMSGSFPISARKAMLPPVGQGPSEMASTVVWEFWFSRVLAAAMSGDLLAASGAILQTVVRNAVADPSLVGVSQGAGLAAVTLVVVFPDAPIALRPALAFLGALLVAGLIQSLSAKRGGGATLRFILTGIGVAAFLSAITQAMLNYGDINQALSAIAWLAGSIHAMTWAEVCILAVCVLLMIPALIWVARSLWALRMRPDLATELGVTVARDRAIAVVISIGLAACGGDLVAAADYIGRTDFALNQIPASLLTAIIGAPNFACFLLRIRG